MLWLLSAVPDGVRGRRIIEKNVTPFRKDNNLSEKIKK